MQKKSVVDFDICHRKVSAKIVFRDQDLFKVENYNFHVSETIRASVKMCGSSFVDFDFCHRMA